ncbi:MAG: thiol reductant ABC exporter subunit CydC [Hyphomicrobiales bacterium]|nr:thiol reductant ABC exporter subunit CydC [Hyphomicrobiales bacterium]
MSDLRRLLGLYRPYRWRMAASIALSLAATFANIGLLAVSGWFIAAMATAGLAQAAINYFTPSATIRLLAILRTGGRYADRLLSHETTFRLLAETRAWLFARLVPLAPAAIEDLRSGDLLARLKTDIDRLELVFLRLIAPVVVAAATLALAGFVLGALDWKLGAAVTAAYLVFAIAVPALLVRRSVGASAKIAEAAARLRAGLVDVVQGLGPLLAAGAADWRRRRVDSEFADLVAAERKTARMAALGQAAAGLAADLAMIAALLVAIPLVRAGAISGPQLVMSVLLALAAMEAFAGLPAAFSSLPATLASARRIFALADRTPAVDDPSAPRIAPSHFDICFERVGLSYRPGSPPALVDIDFFIPQGAHVGVVGRSGAGKSSLIELLVRFRDPTEGTVRIGGVPLRELAGDTVRGLAAVVAQRPHLFSTTIADNLRIAKPDATDAQLEDAARRAGLAPLLARLPAGLRTEVGVAGQALSGGEMRRVAIARALLDDAPIVVLDEPGEGLDAETERDVIGNIVRECAGRTILLLTHSHAGLDLMDRILRLEGGRLASQADPGMERKAGAS